MKLCIFCKYHVYDKDPYSRQHLCTFYQTKEIDPVTGDSIVKGSKNCYDMRSKSHECGREGRLWESIKGGNNAAPAQKQTA